PPPGAGKRQSLDQEQMLDPQHLLDILASVDARCACRLRDAEIRKLRFPRSQDVRLHLHQIAHLSGLEQGPLRNLDVGRSLRHSAKSIADRFLSFAAEAGDDRENARPRSPSAKQTRQTPECPKPRTPRSVSGSSATSSHATRATGATISC